MQDRISTYPGRVRLIPVSGQEDVYDLVRADQPTQEGTPLSKGTLLTDDVAIALGLDPVTGTVSKALGAVRPIELGGTSGTTQTEAFNNIVAPGGEITGKLILKNGEGLNAHMANGTVLNLISRHTSDNIWVGSAEGGTQGGVILATRTDGNAFVSRDNVRSKILDYGIVGKSLWTGSWSVGEDPKTIAEAENYTIFLTATATNTTPFLLYRNGTRISGGGLYASGAKNWINAVSFTISGNQLTYSHSGTHSVGLGSGAIGDLATDNLTLVKLIGIV